MDKVFELIVKYSNLLVSGVEITISLSVIATVLGLMLGIIFAIMKISKVKLLNTIAACYVEIIRGTPVMIQLCIAYYGASAIGISYPRISMFGGACTSDRLIAGIIGLGVNAGAQICEIIRSGIQSIDYGQTEASLSLGMNKFNCLKKIVLPQAIINILPALANDFVNMIKTSSNVTIIGLADLMYVSNLIRGQSYLPFEPFIIAGSMYFILTFGLSNIIKLYEKHINKSRQR